MFDTKIRLPKAEDDDGEVLRSSQEAAQRGFYGYGRVSPGTYAPYADSSPREIVLGPNQNFEFRVGEDYVTAAEDAALVCYNSVTCWRVSGVRLPSGRCYDLIET